MYSVLSTLFVIGVFLVVAGFLGRVGTDGISDVSENVAAAIGLLVTYAFLILSLAMVQHIIMPAAIFYMLISNTIAVHVLQHEFFKATVPIIPWTFRNKSPIPVVQIESKIPQLFSRKPGQLTQLFASIKKSYGFHHLSFSLSLSFFCIIQ